MVPLTALPRLSHVTLINPAPLLVSRVEGVPRAASAVKDKVPASAGAAPFGDTWRLKASLSALTPLLATRVTGMRVMPPAVEAEGVVDTTPCTVPACEKIKLCPAITSVPERALEAFAVIENDTEPVPDPAAVEVIVRNASSDAAAHTQPDDVEIAMSPADGVAGNTAADGVNVKPQT